MNAKTSSVLIVGLLLIAAVTGWGVVSAVREAVSGPAEAGGGMATQVQRLFNPTPTINPGPAVILQIRSLARLEAAQYTIEKVITAETGQGALAGLFGDRLLFVAHGVVIAGVDLSRLQDRDVSLSGDGQVTIILPAAEVFVATLDNGQSYVYDRDTGIFTNGDVNLETQARQVAEVEIQKAALEDGILQTAQTNASVFVERLLYSLGFKNVTVIIATPTPR